ncbi:hypothetical protein HELRODRAFT_140337, partial [Helobdella robusta]|uniref:GBD/FH3 domain-containing protein n=1 Tax=Helobdella robusta TaxID=6412 RepID=T1EJ06_HELRO
IVVRVQYLNDLDPFNNSQNFLEPTRPVPITFWLNIPLQNQINDVKKLLQAPHKLEDCALQLYKHLDGQQGEYCCYLDLESTLQDQQDELDELINQFAFVVVVDVVGMFKRNVLVLRTQLCVRNLLNCSEKDLKRCLLKLKSMFQFIMNDGLGCFIKLGGDFDGACLIQILKVLGQIMLYVDGMNGVIEHNLTIQWLYMLVDTNLRSVIKMSLKLLLVFVEYNDTNCILLTRAVTFVDGQSGNKPWSNIMKLLHDTNNSDNELLVYAMTLVNKVTLSAVPDQDTFYDITDSLEEQGMEEAMRK